MEEKRKYSKVNFIPAAIPTVAFLLIQVISTFVCLAMIIFVTAFIAAGQGQENAAAIDMNAVMIQAQTWYMSHLTAVMAVSQVAGILIFGLWYYLGFVRKRVNTDKKMLNGRSILIMLLAALGFYLAVGSVLNGLAYVRPDVMADYNELMETAGLTGLTVLSTVATLILAPVGEELVFRGLTMKYLKKTGIPFLAVNILQAALFGLVHMNWVQGIYAFALGLVLGFFAEKYGTLKAAILFHMFFNFFGTYLAALLQGFEESLWLKIGLLIAAVVILFVSVRMMKKELYKEENI